MSIPDQLNVIWERLSSDDAGGKRWSYLKLLITKTEFSVLGSNIYTSPSSLTSSIRPPFHIFSSLLKHSTAYPLFPLSWRSYYSSLQKQKYFIGKLLMFLLQIHPLIIVHQELVLLSTFPIQLVTRAKPLGAPWFFSPSHRPHSSRKFRSVNTHDSTLRIRFDIQQFPPSTPCT